MISENLLRRIFVSLKPSYMRLNLFFMVTLTAVACADTLLTTEGYAGKPPGGTPLAASSTIHLGGGIYETKIDATSYSEWAYFDFEAVNQITVPDAMTNSQWDIAFERFLVKTNGGVSGNAGVLTVALDGDNFSMRTQAPSPFGPTKVDHLDAGDADDACRPTTSGVLFAFLDSTAIPNACWFSYSSGVLIPRDITYVVKTANAKYFKIKILAYYGSTGTSGKIRFQWGEIAAP